jgi:hypothetical protein
VGVSCVNSIMKRLWLIFIVTIFPLTCDSTEFECEQHNISKCNSDDKKTNIRVFNNSDYDFCNVLISTTGEGRNHGEIKSGENTCYRTYDKAYNYAYVSLMIDGEDLVIQPIDYVGETPLGVGYFTYHLDVEEINNKKQLSIYATSD